MSAKDLAQIYTDWDKEYAKYVRGWRFYKGLQSEFFASAKARRLLQKAGVEDMDRLNFAAIAVDTVIDRLHVSGVNVGDSDADRELVGSIIRENELEQEEQVLFQYLGAMGEAIAVVLPAEDDGMRPSGVAVSYWNPKRARILYDDLDPLRKVAGVLTWPDRAGKTTRADLYYADGTLERWLGKGEGRKLHDPAAWSPWEGEDAEGNALPSEESLDFEDTGLPFFHYRTGRPEAEPLHRKAFGPQQAIDKIVVSHLATIDTASFPQRYGQIDPEADVSGAGTSMNPFHPGLGDDDDPESEANGTQLSADPGSMWRLRGYIGVGQFAVATAEVFMSPLDRYVRAMAQVTRIPMHYFDPSGDAPSGESLKVSDAPITHRVNALKTNCGAVMEDQWSTTMAFAGGGSDLVVRIRWAPHETATDLAAWQTVAAKIAAGVPVKVALVEAGYDPEDVEEWLSRLDDSGEIGRQIAMLDQLGDALTKLAQAEALGIKADTTQLVADLVEAMSVMWGPGDGA